MKKWRAPQTGDQIHFDNGIYDFADKPDEFGPRAFMALNLIWDDSEMTFLSDAATHWGKAPWALSLAREPMRIRPLGTWTQAVALYAKPFSLLSMACRENGDSASNYGGLLLLRSAMRMESISAGKTVGVDVARHCLRMEIERDSMIQKAKAAKHAAEHPEWTAPESLN